MGRKAQGEASEKRGYGPVSCPDSRICTLSKELIVFIALPLSEKNKCHKPTPTAGLALPGLSAQTRLPGTSGWAGRCQHDPLSPGSSAGSSTDSRRYHRLEPQPPPRAGEGAGAREPQGAAAGERQVPGKRGRALRSRKQVTGTQLRTRRRPPCAAEVAQACARARGPARLALHKRSRGSWSKAGFCRHRVFRRQPQDQGWLSGQVTLLWFEGATSE